MNAVYGDAHSTVEVFLISWSDCFCASNCFQNDLSVKSKSLFDFY